MSSYKIVTCPQCNDLYKQYLFGYDSHKFNGCPRCKKSLEDAYAEQERQYEERKDGKP